MNQKATLWLTAVAVGLFGYIYFVDLRHVESTARSEQPARLLPDLEPSQVTSIEISRGSEVVRAERAGGQWRLVNPPYPAQATAIDSFLNALTKLNQHKEIPAREIVSEAGGLAPFGLDPAAASIKIQSGTNLVQFRVGTKTLLGDRVYVQTAGASGVSTTDLSLLEHLPSSSFVWRNPMLIHRRELAFDCIAISAGGRPLRLERDRGTQQWRLVEPMPVRRADFERVEYLIQQLFSSRLSQFVTDSPKADLEPFGLQTPEAELALCSGTNAVFQVQFGKSPTNDPTQVYARRLTHTNVVLVSRELADLVSKPYTEFRDRVLLSFRPSSVDRIEGRADEAFAVQRQGSDDWQIVEPFQAPADRQLMQLFLEDLAKLEIVRFEKDVVTDFSPYGLTDPSRQYTLKTAANIAGSSTNQTVVHVNFGVTPTNELDTVYCQRSDESSVYVVGFADMFRLERAAFALRDRRIWNFASSNVTSIAIVQKGQKRELVRDPSTRKWNKDNPVENAAIEETLHRLGELQADVWTAHGQQQAERFGAAGNKFQLSLGLNETGKSRRLSLQFGNLSTSGQPYAAVPLEQGEPVVFKFPAQLYGLVVEYLGIPASDSEP